MSESAIKGDVLVGLVNKKIKPLIDERSSYGLRIVDPISLLTSERFDLVPKIIYAEHRIRHAELGWPLEGYLAHLDRINGFVEADASSKLGPDAFVGAFNSLIDNMMVRGFDSRWPVPLSDGRPLDGAHRIAAAIALGIPTFVVDIGAVEPHQLNAADLSIRGVSLEFIDHWATKYARLNKASRLVFIWPSAASRDSELDAILAQHGSVVHRKSLRLSPQGQVNIIRTAYRSEPWVGCIEDGFVGAVNKAKWCFDRPGPLRIFLMEGVKDWILLKEDVRALFDIEKNSIHINDTHAETIELSELIFNRNGLEFLDRHVPASFPWLSDLQSSYIEWLSSVGETSDNYCLVGSSVLGVYGIREPRDLDFVAMRNANVNTGMKEIDCHNGQVDWGVSDEHLVVDPRLHFVCGGNKYLAPSVLISQKKGRGEVKDLVDVEALTDILLGATHSAHRRPVTFATIKGQLKFVALKLRFYAKRRIAKLRP